MLTSFSAPWYRAWDSPIISWINHLGIHAGYLECHRCFIDKACDKSPASFVVNSVNTDTWGVFPLLNPQPFTPVTGGGARSFSLGKLLVSLSQAFWRTVVANIWCTVSARFLKRQAGTSHMTWPCAWLWSLSLVWPMVSCLRSWNVAVFENDELAFHTVYQHNSRWFSSQDTFSLALQNLDQGYFAWTEHSVGAYLVMERLQTLGITPLSIPSLPGGTHQTSVVGLPQGWYLIIAQLSS